MTVSQAKNYLIKCHHFDQDNHVSKLRDKHDFIISSREVLPAEFSKCHSDPGFTSTDYCYHHHYCHCTK